MVEDSSDFRWPNETSSEALSSGNCLVTVIVWFAIYVSDFRRPYSCRVSRKKVYFLKSSLFSNLNALLLC